MKPDDYPEQPAHLWEHFYRITRIPRPSRAEQAVRQYVIEQAEGAGCGWRMDEAGNLRVAVPASAGREASAPVIIQNHLDMVTVKTEDKRHDFTRDPLELRVENGWLCADRTTLGADNGLGCAAALALMTDPEVQHPPLELLFTVDEETGLGGALALDPGLLSGPRLLNLDTEEWHELYVGCAGGGGWRLARCLDTETPPRGHSGYQLALRGLAGGHSGIQIHEQLGNAIKLLVQWLAGAGELAPRLAAVTAGTAHNVIPGEGTLLFTSAAPREALRASLEACRQRWLGYLPAADAGLSLTLQTQPVPSVLTAGAQQLVQDLVALFPHGALAYSRVQPAELVDLSANLAQLRLADGEMFLEGSYRFFNEEETVGLQQAVAALARQFDLSLEAVPGYPGWQPDYDSPLLARAKALHETLFGSAPAVKAIHAGLECGILKSKMPEVDMLSFGPTIRGAHSPTERLRVDTVGPFWTLLTELLAQL
jgi:dipeptidase D